MRWTIFWKIWRRLAWLVLKADQESSITGLRGGRVAKVGTGYGSALE